MSIDPRILQRMASDDTAPELPNLELSREAGPRLEKPAGDEPGKFPLAPGGQPPLRGTPKQVAWAATIRNGVLSLGWPGETRALLQSVDDATWWIANKAAVSTMKFKLPSPGQTAGQGGAPAALAGAPQTFRPHGSGQIPSPVPALVSGVSPVVHPQSDLEDVEARMSDAEQWARSIAGKPALAEAAILAVLASLYTEPPMKQALKTRASALLSNWLAAASPGRLPENEKDVDAIRRILKS
jgi:hypothetical protein